MSGVKGGAPVGHPLGVGMLRRLSDYNLFVKCDSRCVARWAVECTVLCYVVVNATPAKYTVYGGIPRCAMPGATMPYPIHNDEEGAQSVAWGVGGTVALTFFL